MVITALDGSAGGAGFGEGLSPPGDHGGFGRLRFEELIIGGGSIKRDYSIDWIRGGRSEVEELKEGKEESAIAQHHDSRL